MRTDHTTYQLATRVSIAGLLLQAAASFVILVFGYAAKDHVAQACGWYMFFGLPVWATLIILFHQHRLERLEALEAEQIHAQQGQTTSIFDAGSDLNVAARRLRWMHQFFLPLMSLVTAGGFLAVGFWQLSAMNARLDTTSLNASYLDRTLLTASKSEASWGLVFSAFIALACFVFSRYVSGMSNQRAWRHLRAGASVTVGVAIFSAMLAVALGFAVMENTAILGWMARIVPYLILLAGAEIAVNFVLNMYRPRKAGEFPRPAFDSRILSLAAAPDTLARSISDAVNYQFGFDVTSTWGYRLISRQAWVLILFFVGILLSLNCVTIVRPHEQAILTSFGNWDADAVPYDSGLVFKWPWQKLEAYAVHRVHRIKIGKDEDDDDHGPLLWGKAHTAETEDLVIVGPSIGSGGLATETADGEEDNVVAQNYSVLNLEVPIQYRVKTGPGELWNYIQLTAGGEHEREDYIKSIATRVVTQHAANLRIDDVLGSGRSQLAYDLRARLQGELDQLSAGIEILFVGISDIHPPVDVAPLFQEVLKAGEERESAIQAAQASAVSVLADMAGSEEKARAIALKIGELEATATVDPLYQGRRAEVERLMVDAGGAAAMTLLQAQAARWDAHLSAWTKFIEQDSQLAGLNAAPRLYRFRQLLARTSAALSKARLYIVAPGYENQVELDLHEDRAFISTGPGL